MRQPKLLVTLGLTFAAVGTLVVASAPAAPTAANASDDVSVRVAVGVGGGPSFATKVRSPFELHFRVETVVGLEQTITLTFHRPEGLRWGADAPDPTEGCVGDAPIVCTQRLEQVVGSSTIGGWWWDVHADRLGMYEVTASVQTELPDPDLANNTHTFRFEVEAGPTGTGGGGGSSGGSGGSAAVSASAARVTPAKPKAGSAVTASVRVSAGGSPVRPAGVACTGAIGSLKLRGTPRAASGAASCTFRTPGAAKGKTLAGSVAFRAGGKRFSKRFSVRLG